VYVALPGGAILIGYLGYRAYLEHPSTRLRRLQNKASALYDSIIRTQEDAAITTFADFDTFSSRYLPKLNTAPNSGVVQVLFTACRQLYEDEQFAEPPPRIPQPCTNLDWARYVDTLSRLAAKLPNKNAPRVFFDATLDSLRVFHDALPRITLDATANTAPYAAVASSIIENAASVVEQMILPFYSEEATESGLFARLREQLDRNLHEMSGIPYAPEYYHSPKLIMPVKHKSTPLEIINGYLRHTPLRQLFDARMPFAIPAKHRFEGTWVLAPRGRGKTTLLSTLLKSDLEEVKDGRASIILMDTKGDLMQHVPRLKRFAPGGDLEGRLIYLDPEQALAINPLDLGTTSAHSWKFLQYVFTSLLGSEFTAHQETVLRYSLLAVSAIPGATLNTLHQLLNKGWQPWESHVRALRPEYASFFTDGRFDDPNYRARAREVSTRIDKLLIEVPLLLDSFAAEKTRFSMAKAMDEGKVIVIDNSERKLSSGLVFFSRFFIALVLAAAQARSGRPQHEKLPCYFYIDECDLIISEDREIVEIANRCRSQNVGLVLAHQALYQIKEKDVRDVLADCSVRFANVTNDAPAMAHLFNTDADRLSSLSRGQFALYLHEITRRGPMIVDIPNDPVMTWPKMTDAEFRTIREQMRQAYSIPRADADVIPLKRASILGEDPAEFRGPGSTNPDKW
jgi:hypothetical protein